jgi:coenzyme F420-dependent glucose-6-phosphate dehydrogenase
MITLGYKLSSEEQSAADLVRYAQSAQDTGFTFALIPDHYHPWTDRQGQSPSTRVITADTSLLKMRACTPCPTHRLRRTWP